MIQHVARGLFGAIIVDPKNSKAWAKADREYVLVQSEFFKNPDDVQAMFDRKYDNVLFNGRIFKYHPLVTHSLTGALRGAIAVLLVGPDAKPASLMPIEGRFFISRGDTQWICDPIRTERFRASRTVRT